MPAAESVKSALYGGSAMQKSMAYVIGVGGAGVEVVERLYWRQGDEGTSRTAPGLMSIDADGSRLDKLPAEVPTVHLTSDDGLVGHYAAEYPFLPEDATIPADNADWRRHVGRYKFDNGASPEYENYYEEVEAVLEQFIGERSTALSGPTEGTTFDIFLVLSLGGGTGSGVFPLLATILAHVADKFDNLKIRIFGVGIVPPLDFDLERGFPPANPAVYPNTYGALRNLSTLFDARNGNPVRLPIYSTVDPTAFDGDTALGEAIDSDGTVFELTESPFDGFWLASTRQGSSGQEPLQDGMAPALSIVAGAVEGFSSCGMYPADRPDSSACERSPFFGTVGYATLRVPHSEVRGYCQRKRERNELSNHLDSVRSRLEKLHRKRERLGSALRTRTAESESRDWITRVRHRVDSSSGTELDDLVETSQTAFENVLDDISEEYRTGSYIQMLSALERAFSEGELQQSINATLERTYRSVWSNHAENLTTDHTQLSGSLDERFEQLEELLDEHIDACQRQLEQTDYGVRDLFPPKHDLLTTRRERLEARLAQLRRDADRVAEARAAFASFQLKRSDVERRLEVTRTEVHSRLDELETELSQARARRDDIRDELSACDADLASYRQSLTDPEDNGPEFVLPLDREALVDLTLDELDSTCTSIAGYSDQNLLAGGPAELTESLERCIDFSRDWPDAIADHDPAKTVAPRREQTYLVSDEANSSLLSELHRSLSVSDESWIPSAPDQQSPTVPYRIDVVSTARKGRPDSLLGYQWLHEQAADGVFDAYNTYDDYRLALAYPEWYASEIPDGLD